MLVLKESFNSLSCSFLSSTRCFLGILNACYYLIIKFSKIKKYRTELRRPLNPEIRANLNEKSLV